MKPWLKFALGISAAAVLLVGCGSQPPFSAPRSMPQTRANRLSAGMLPTGQSTFRFTGKKQVFIVPSRVYQIKVWVHGGSGANDTHRYKNMHRSIGGYGGRVTAIIPVTPFERLVVYVGGDGSGSTGGFNGGGNGSLQDKPDGLGGGGASDIREHGDARGDRIVVAGGGGAGGDGFGYTYRGYANGGKGGGIVADSGGPGGDGPYFAIGGGGGSQTYGGDGGAAQSDCEYYAVGLPGTSGTFGVGGSGGNGGLHSYSAGGGGGGGGGGGSSYIESSASDVHSWKGWKGNEHGLVAFDW